MKNLKLFNTKNDYLAYRDSSEYLKPNVSLSDDKGSVYYNFTPPPDSNGHDYVDLGLPSGTKWATMNVGASKPSDAGQYFQWGDTSGYTADQVGTGDGQKAFTWADYKWRLSGDNEDNVAFKKYTGFEDTLTLEDDAAHVNMGGSWHMPTPKQIQELLNNTTTAFTTSDGVSGMTFTSKNGSSKSIFIPATGVAWDGSIHYSGDYGNFWSSMQSTYDVSYGQYLSFYSDSADLSDGDNRYYGFSVRGVLG